jgi:hypothetical protein
MRDVLFNFWRGVLCFLSPESETFFSPHKTKTNSFFDNEKSSFVAVIVWSLNLQLPMQSVPITTDVVGLSPA